MNSIEEKKKTIHENQFDKKLKETKEQIDVICKGIDVKKAYGRKHLLSLYLEQKILY